MGAGCVSGTIPGLEQTHVTIGQIPQFQAADRGLNIKISGSIDPSGYISLVDITNNTGAAQHSIYYPDPCGIGGQGEMSSSGLVYHTGPKAAMKVGSSAVGFCEAVDTDAQSICDNN